MSKGNTLTDDKLLVETELIPLIDVITNYDINLTRATNDDRGLFDGELEKTVIEQVRRDSIS